MSVVKKVVPLSKVQTLAAEFVFGELAKANQEYQRAEAVAKSRYALILVELGIEPKHVETANYDNGPTGATISYDYEDGVQPVEAVEAAPVFDIPPQGEN